MTALKCDEQEEDEYKCDNSQNLLLRLNRSNGLPLGGLGRNRPSQVSDGSPKGPKQGGGR